MFLLLLACTFSVDDTSSEKETGKDPHETDADTDADSDADTDADTDTDTEYTGSDISKLCDKDLPSSPPAGPDCMSGELSCDSEVIATTEGGTDHFAGDDYTHNFCFTNLYNHDYDAPERVYGLTVPAKTTATIRLDSPCLDLDFAVLRWYDDGTCPGDDGYEVCEGDDGDEGGSVEVSPWDVETYWLVVVDGKYDTDLGNFRVLVSCD